MVTIMSTLVLLAWFATGVVNYGLTFKMSGHNSYTMEITMWEAIDNWYAYFIIGFTVLVILGLGYEIYKESNKDE